MIRTERNDLQPSARRIATAIATSGIGLFLFATTAAMAHPISLSETVVDVREDRIAVTIEHLVEDFLFYQDLEPVENRPIPFGTVDEKAQAHHAFLSRHFALRDQDGKRYGLELVSIDLADIPQSGVPQDDLMGYSVSYAFEAPLDPGERPRFLSVYQNFGGTEEPVPAEMRVRLLHRGIDMREPVVLAHGTVHVYELDWDIDFEALKATEDEKEQRRLLAEFREDDGLSLTSYSWVYNYVYINEREVRHEILVPFFTLESWFPIGRDSEEVLTVAEQRAVEEDLLAFLRKHNRVKINGTPVAVELAQLEFFGPGHRDFARQAPVADVGVYGARAGVIVSFPATEPPREVEFVWDFFNRHMDHLTPRIYPYDGELRRGYLDSFERRIVWRRPDAPELAALETIPPPQSPPRVELPLVTIAGGFGFALATLCLLSASTRGSRGMFVAIGVSAAVAAVWGTTGPRASLPQPFSRAEPLSEPEARAIFEPLHRNLYRAFERRTEEEIYDTLAKSVAGPLREEIYLYIRQKLAMEDQGGSLPRVEEVGLENGRLKEVAADKGAHRAFQFEAVWTVTGTVEHWGHIHSRHRRYAVLFTLQGYKDEGWRITAYEPGWQEDLEQRTEVRR
jgi:hypothetical protein